MDSSLGIAFAGRPVFVTGHTGFKGSWLVAWLHALGAQVTGYALAPPTVPSNFVASGIRDLLDSHHETDIRDRGRLEAALRASRPDVVLHLAAQSVVRAGFSDPVETFSVNVMGTAVLLEAIRSVGRPCAVVVISSDKCYANDESGRAFRESDPLGGDDPYSASKGAVELVTAAFRRSFFDPERLDAHGIAIATARAGNVIGGGDWTPDGVIADTVRALSAGEPVRLRNPRAVRPWQHVLEPLAGYLQLAVALLGPTAAKHCRAWNFGPLPDDDASVGELVTRFISAWGHGEWVDGSDPDQPRESQVLRLSTQLAVGELGWRPRWRLARAIDRTAAWYARYSQAPADARAATLADIASYMASDDAA